MIDQFRAAFQDEARELLEELEHVVMDLEDNPHNQDALEKGFRAMHTIKGGSGMAGYLDIEAFTHEFETLFDQLRSGKIFITPKFIELSLGSVDLIRQMLAHPNEGGELDPRAVEILAGARSLIDGAQSTIPAGETPSGEEAVAPSEALSLYYLRIKPHQEILANGTDVNGLIEELLEMGNGKALANLGPIPEFEELLVENCYVNWEILLATSEKAETLNGVFMFVDDMVEIDMECLAEGIGEDVSGLVAESCFLLRDAGPEALRERFAADPSPLPDSSETETPETKRSSGGDSNGQSEASVRVNISKLNELMDLVGEIVISESLVTQHPNIINAGIPDLESVTEQLQKNIRSLQEVANAMRMVPIDQLFRKMKRLVRDVSARLGKQINLQLFGNETEIDRGMIEKINDPLVHILRNAMDHGLELPKDRKKAGKSELGQIELSARQVGSEILVTVRDDGRGLNREKILSKAREKGLIQGDGENLSDDEVWRLIMNPGFSTAETVTDLSGRGVGMDVVCKNLEGIGGQIVLHSNAGKGTMVQLHIPLTTAIVDGMLIRVENRIYAIPMLDIQETRQVEDGQVVQIVDGDEVIQIRGVLYPVIRLREYHNLSFDKKSLNEGLVVLSQTGGQRIAIFVDELIEQKQLVIKPIPSYLGRIPGVSGCTILGSSDICLVLDVLGMVRELQD